MGDDCGGLYGERGSEGGCSECVCVCVCVCVLEFFFFSFVFKNEVEKVVRRLNSRTTLLNFDLFRKLMFPSLTGHPDLPPTAHDTAQSHRIAVEAILGMAGWNWAGQQRFQDDRQETSTLASEKGRKNRDVRNEKI